MTAHFDDREALVAAHNAIVERKAAAVGLTPEEAEKQGAAIDLTNRHILAALTLGSGLTADTVLEYVHRGLDDAIRRLEAGRGDYVDVVGDLTIVALLAGAAFERRRRTTELRLEDGTDAGT